MNIKVTHFTGFEPLVFFCQVLKAVSNLDVIIHFSVAFEYSPRVFGV
jgi:hypothetical protein